MSNNHYYTPIQLHDLFDYIFPKIDFTIEDLTTDTGCTFTFKHPEAENEVDKNYERDFIEDIMLKIKQADIDIPYNSHDWIKIYKHAFQHTELVNFHNIKVMQAWYVFSNFFRDACKNDQINPKDYNIHLKHFMAMLIFHESELAAKCLHQFFNLAYKIHSNEKTAIDSQKVANMLGGVFYTALKIQGIHTTFKLLDLDIAQQQLFIRNVQKIPKILKHFIEDPFFGQDFDKNDYTQFLIIGNTTAIPYQSSPRIEVLSYENRLPDESFIKKFKLKNTCNDVDSELPINEIRNLSLSENRSSRRGNFSREDASVRVSFSDECLMKHSPRRILHNDTSCSPERRDKIESSEVKKNNHWASSSLGEKKDKLGKKRKEDGDIKQSFNLFNKFECEVNPEIERRGRKILFFSSSEASFLSRSPDGKKKEMRLSKERSLSPHSSPEIEKRNIFLDKDANNSPETTPDAERRNVFSSIETCISHELHRKKHRSSKEMNPKKLTSSKETSLSPHSSPEIEKRMIHSDNENNLSPDSGPNMERRKSFSSKESSLSPDSGRRTLRTSKEIKSSCDAKTKKYRSSLESSLSPENKRRVLFSSEETIPEKENEILIFSAVNNNEHPTPEINNEAILEELSLAQNSGIALK